MKMDGMELIVVKNSIEEVGERGNQPREDTMHEEGVEGATRGLRFGGAGPKRGLSPLIAVARRHQERGGKVLLRDRGRAQGRLEPQGRTHTPFSLSVAIDVKLMETIQRIWRRL